MAHYAKIENGIVVEVNVAEQEWVDQQPDKDKWFKTSYNSRGGVHYLPNSNKPSGNPHFRFNYAGIGFTYDKERDAFIPPKPFESWVLNEQTCLWNAPIEYLKDGYDYTWDENLINWVKLKGE